MRDRSSCRAEALARSLASALLVVFLAAGAAQAKAKTFPVELRVDFGPADKPLRVESLEVNKGSTPRDAVSMVFPIMTGYACCDSREVVAIDGTVINPAENLWWVCELNGTRKKVSPHKTKLKAGDVVTWKFIAELQ